RARTGGPARSHGHPPSLYTTPHRAHLLLLLCTPPSNAATNPIPLHHSSLALGAMDPRAAASVLALFVAAAMSPAVVVVGDFAADRAECSDKLVGLATCLTYVQDEASAPTPDCCAGLKTVLQSSRKCLCVLVKDKDDPNLGLKLNVTKALGLPAVCNAPANISDCPRLLNLAPNSKEAQVFEQYAKQAAAQGTTPSATGGGSAATAAGAQKSGAAGHHAGRWLGVGTVGDGGARAVVLALLAAAAPLAAPFLILLLG
uniref:Bifunctional inhibitor/plant lipid transfer protein/seed storage helical domain-containing protein n=3 Tax=Setaria TaxID=4554 RepID=A0A0Q3VKX5_SETIT